MKKNKFEKLRLEKKTISKLKQATLGGFAPAETCEGPCQGGTGCCRPPKPDPSGSCTSCFNCH